MDRPLSGDRTTPALRPWQPASARDRRLVSTVRGFRVLAVMLGVAIVTSRASNRR